ncbi:MAG: hypothetical protein SFU53_12920 [Terrimicrobiaceae bacterium]|nr:hypothetical protein [Terrimicrobiaceae bacterium]
MQSECAEESSESDRWTSLLREKLVPMGWVIPAGDGLFEWTRAFRDLLFEIAEFLRTDDRAPAECIQDFILTESGSRLLKDLTVSEIASLMCKARDFGLDARVRDSVRSPRPPAPLRHLHGNARSLDN